MNNMITQKMLAELVDDVALPFEKKILQDERVASFLPDEKTRAVHNLGIVKLCIAVTAKGKIVAADMLKKGSEAHSGLEFDKEILREYLSLFFKLHTLWIKKHFPDMLNEYERNLQYYEEVFMKAYKPYLNSEKDEFFDFDSEDVDEMIENMHYSDDNKTDAKTFMKEEVFDSDMIADVKDAIEEIVLIDTKIADDLFIKNSLEILVLFIRVFDFSYEFKDIAYALNEMSQKLKTINIFMLEDEQKELYKNLVESVLFDLKKWANEVLFEQSAVDIHYLDASLLANIAQIDIMISYSKKD